jgi:non-specific serine/threonine protein kinase
MVILDYALGHYADLRMVLEESQATARTVGDDWLLAFSLIFAAMDALGRGDRAAARAASQESLIRARQSNDLWLSAFARMIAGADFVFSDDYQGARAHLVEALSDAEAAGERWLTVVAACNLADLVRRQGDCDHAFALTKQSIARCQELGERSMAAMCLQQFAGIAVVRRQLEKAARLYGAAEELREAVGYPIEAIDRPFYDQDVAALRAQLDPATLADAWAAGRRLTLEQATHLALEETPDV